MLKITYFPKNHSCFFDLFKLFFEKKTIFYWNLRYLMKIYFFNKGISASLNPMTGLQNGILIFCPLKIV